MQNLVVFYTLDGVLPEQIFSMLALEERTVSALSFLYLPGF